MPDNFNKLMIKSSSWIIAAHVLSQIIRLGSNILSTRLLEPSMYGLIALVMIVLQGLAMFTDMGLWSFIVRQGKNIQSNVIDTVWTIQVLRGWTIFIIALILSGLLLWIQIGKIFTLNGVYNHELLPILLLVISLTIIFSGYTTMASAILGRDLIRGRLEIAQLLTQIVGSSVMLVWAWHSPTIWALVAGIITASIVSVFINYIAFPYRHSFTWDKLIVKNVMTYSKWVVVSSFLTFLCIQGDRLILANYFNAVQLGIYSVAFTLVSAPISMMQELSAKMIFPLFCKKASESKQSLVSLYYQVRLIQDGVVFFFTGSLIALANPIITLLYDARYSDSGGMLKIFAFVLPAVTILEVGQEYLSAINITKVRAQIMFFRSIGVFVGLPVLYYFYDINGALWAVVLSYWLGLPCLYRALHKQNLIIFKKELRMVPLGFIGYALCVVIINFFQENLNVLEFFR